MRTGETDEAGNEGTILLANLPPRLGWLLVVLAMPVSYVFYASIVDSGNTAEAGWLLPFLFALLTAIVLSWLVLRGASDGMFYLTALLCTAIAEFAWYTSGLGSGDVWAYPVLILGLTYRIHRWQSARSLTEENRTSFVLETALTIAAIVFLVLTQTSGVVRDWLTFILIASLGLRVYAMWEVERLETGSRGARGNFGLLILGTIALVILGPKIVYWLIVGVAGGSAILGLPLLYLLNAILPKHLRPFTLRSPTQFQTLLKHMQQQSHSVTSGPTFPWLPYVIYALFLAAAIVLVWRVSKRRFMVRQEPEQEKETVTIRRQRISPTRGHGFLSTDNPVRLKYQEFLRTHALAGDAILPAETPAEYARRLETPDHGKGDAKDIVPLTKDYESARYGKQKAQDES